MRSLLPAAPATAAGEQRAHAPNGWRELGFLALVYASYTLTRVVASDALAPARDRARQIVDIEQPLGLDFERTLNDWFAGHDLLGTLAAFHYASAHYVVTTLVLVWLLFRRADVYVVARRALVIATSIALALYLLAPTAPPRLVGGFTDVLAQHSATGWWGGEASAPQGLGSMTNQLAAFPSMHAGWALWVALAITAAVGSRVLRAAAWTHALVTAVVVIGTGNHWTLDIVVGWALIAFVWRLASPQARPWPLPRSGLRSGGEPATFLTPGIWAGDRRPRRPARRAATGVAGPQFSVRKGGSLTAGRAGAGPGPGRTRADPDGPGRVDPGGRTEPQSAASRASALRTSAPSFVVHIGGSEALRKPP